MNTEVKKLDGKAFIEELNKCGTTKELFTLLDKTMDRATLKDRMSNIDKLNEKNVDLILAFHAANAKAKGGMKGVKISHQDCVNMAVSRYKELTGRGYKGFKIELNKYQTGKAKSQSIEMAVDSKLFAKMRGERTA
ncbi:MAG: hypothetical protein NC218_04630 [Acetobacter sp.]|nr:hypothetical protein [Acetobacter sp.]